MKLRNKILIGLLCIALVSQIPFFINRWRVANLSEQIVGLDRSRILPSGDSGYTDYKGVIHVHSFLGGHSTGTFDELLSAASSDKLDFVVMTEHVSDFFDTSAMTLRDKHKEVFFIGGSETSVKDENRFLVLEGFPEVTTANKQNTKEFLSDVHLKGGLALVTYPEKFKAWDSKIDGIEVFSLHTNAKKMNPLTFPFDMIWSYRSHPELTLARYFKRPNENLARFDQLSKTRRLTLFAGNDAHSNLGFHVGDDANNKFLDLKFDRYETIFKLVRTHILIPNDEPLEKETLLEAIKAGHTYIGIDVLSDSSGFTFCAENGDETKISGDEIALINDSVNLKAFAPQFSRFVVFKNGSQFFESGQTSEINLAVKEPGTYRVEVYLDTLGSPFDKMPWIISNPIYVK